MQLLKCNYSAKKGDPPNTMHSKHLLKYLVILALLMFAFSAIPAAAQEGEGESTEEATPPACDAEIGEAVEGAPADDVDNDGVVDCVPEEDENSGDEETTPPADDEETTPPADDEETAAPADDEENAAPTDDEENAAPTDEEQNAAPTGETNNNPAESQDDATPEENNADILVPADDANNTDVEATDSGDDSGVTIEGGTIIEDAGEEAIEPVAAADDVDTAALPGSFTSQIIGVANLKTPPSGAGEAVNLELNEIAGGDTGTVTKNVFPGGVAFIKEADLTSITNGSFAGVLSSGFPAAAAVLTVNQTAFTADMYPGLSGEALGTTLYGTLIFNNHAGLESRMYCQNASSGTLKVTARLFKTGSAAQKASKTSPNLAVGEGVAWSMADFPAWVGGNGEFGYAIFESNGGNIACVIDNQRIPTPSTQAQFQAVPTTTAGKDLRLPLVFNGHGSSYNPQRVAKYNTGISIVNINNAAASVTVLYNMANGATHTCSINIASNSSATWFAPEIGTGTGSGVGWTCPSGPIPFATGYTLGSVKITSNRDVLAIANSTKRDTSAPLPLGVGWGVGYASLAAKPSEQTKKAVCPIAFNPASLAVANDNWASGIQVANVGGGPTNVTFKMVKANANPTQAANIRTLSGGAFNNVAAGKSVTAYLPAEANALKSFEGVIFVTSSSQNIFAVHSATNYNTLSAAALYNCINY
jgi:hypothetical protein